MKTEETSGSKPDKTGKPTIGITMGDPSGIGPEVVLKSLAIGDIRRICTPVVIGDLDILRQTALSSDLELSFETIDFDSPNTYSKSEKILVCDLKNVTSGLEHGVVSAIAGKAAGQYIETAVDLCQRGCIDAIATAPINKKSFNEGGYDFPGHTEFLAHLTGTSEFRMSFFSGNLRVVLLSIHVSLRRAIELVTSESLIEIIRFTDRELGRLLDKKIKIAVAGLNPHASEYGRFGSEEADHIEPAVDTCSRQFGIDVTGPYSPDTVFNRAHAGEFDAVVAMYHDQATIAVKCLSFGKGINVTLGLPIVRTSVDHGTAFEIAGKNKADSGSMGEAIKLAAELIGNRN